jgi:hypothetical protein
MLLSLDVYQELTGLKFLHAAQIEQDVREGRGHTGIASVVQLLARIP